MIRLSYNQQCEIEGIIKVTKPIRSLGLVTDIYDIRWDIHGIIGDYVQACPENDLHRYFTDTSGNSMSGLINQTWLPYKVEVVDSNKDR